MDSLPHSTPASPAAELADNASRRLLMRLFALLMHLYPGSFRALFAQEMTLVFADALADAAEEGAIAQLRLLARELGELPVALLVEHYHERRQTMYTLTLDTSQEINLARWTARLLSLLLFGLVVVVILLNEDVRTEPSLPLLLIFLLSGSLMAGWRWERLAARISLVGSPILFGLLLAENLSRPALIVPVWMLLLTAAAMAGSFAVVGWLYASVARYGAVAERRARPFEEKEPGRGWNGSRLGILLLLSSIVLAVMLFLIFSGTTPVRQQIEAPTIGSNDTNNVVMALRQAGAVIGVANISAKHPDISIEGTILLVNDDEVLLFDYPSAAAARADISAFGRGEASLQETDVIQADNVLVLLPGVSPQTRDLLLETLEPARR